jgi:hypothetical protein
VERTASFNHRTWPEGKEIRDIEELEELEEMEVEAAA